MKDWPYNTLECFIVYKEKWMWMSKKDHEEILRNFEHLEIGHNQSLTARLTRSGRFSPFNCSPSNVGNITKQASLLRRSISGVIFNSKLLMTSTVRANTSYSANFQPMHVLTPPANESLWIQNISLVRFSMFKIRVSHRLAYTPKLGPFFPLDSRNHLSGLNSWASSPNSSLFLVWLISWHKCN